MICKLLNLLRLSLISRKLISSKSLFNQDLITERHSSRRLTFIFSERRLRSGDPENLVAASERHTTQRVCASSEREMQGPS